MREQDVTLYLAQRGSDNLRACACGPLMQLHMPDQQREGSHSVGKCRRETACTLGSHSRWLKRLYHCRATLSHTLIAPTGRR
jgi:hypothetical protein